MPQTTQLLCDGFIVEAAQDSANTYFDVEASGMALRMDHHDHRLTVRLADVFRGGSAGSIQGASGE
jgi:hypothetical protein